MNISRKYVASLTAKELQARLLKIKGLVTNDDISVYGQMKTAAYADKVCLRKISETRYELSENFGYKGPLEIIIICFLDQIKQNKTVIHFEVVNGSKVSKIGAWLMVFFAVLASLLHLVGVYIAIYEPLTVQNTKWFLIYTALAFLIILGYRYLMAHLFIRQIVKSLGVLNEYA